MKIRSLLNPVKCARCARHHVSCYCAQRYANLSFLLARRYAANRGIPSLAFDRFGRHMGTLEMMSGEWAGGLRNILNPVSCVRYFEYDFCARQMPPAPQLALDISSPRLFSLYLASEHPRTKWVLLNPDPTDMAVTEHDVKLLDLRNVTAHNAALDAGLDRYEQQCDFVSSISVLEHIAGDYDDVAAISLLRRYLKPGGILAVTVPLSEGEPHHDEYLPHGCRPYEGTHQVQAADGRFFFQRVYTESSIRERLLSQVQESDTYTEYCGEKERGRYRRYSHSPLYNRGTDCRFFVDNFAHYESYAEMPGMGICGIRIRRPAGR